MKAVEEAHPEATVEVWCEDEHRVGLLPLERRVWSPVGERPVAAARERYEWTCVWGFCEPSSGQVWWLLLPAVNTAVCSLALAEFAAAMGLGPHKRIVLLLDGAGWHSSGDRVVPEGLHLVAQPPKSPEPQPAERLWPLVNEALANRCFATIEELEAVLAERCLALSAQPDQIAGYRHYHWWPRPAELESPAL